MRPHRRTFDPGGASDITATDLSDFTLALAAKAGADRMLNNGADPDELAGYAGAKGYFDMHYECSGAAAAPGAAIEVVRPGGFIVQPGLGGDMSAPMAAITAKELEVCGDRREPLITHTLPLEQTKKAFNLASNRGRTMKAQIAFS